MKIRIPKPLPANTAIWFLMAVFSSSIHAATVTWDASGDATWSGPSDATSWTGATYNDGDDAQFLGAGTGTVNISGTVNPLSITVNSAAAADYTFAGGGIGGAATLTKTGASRLFLNAANSYTGDTTISGGQIRISHNDALGTAAGKTIIQNATKLELAGGVTIAEPITNQGGGGGKLTSISGTQTLTGLITLEGSMDIRNSNYVFQGGFTSANNSGIGFNGSNYIVETTPITIGNGGFGVTSAGNNPANATEINVGGNDWGLTTINFSGYLKIGGTDFLPTDTQVRFGFNWWTRSPGTLDLNGRDQTVRALGHFALGLGADNKVTGLAGDVLTINLDSGSTYNTYQGRFEGGLSVVKNGDGTLILENLSSTTAPANPSSADPSPGPAIPSTNTGSFTINAGVVESRAVYGATDAITFSDSSRVILAGGTLNLNYAGTDVVGALDLGSGWVAAGVYGSAASGAPNTDPSLTGTGTLTVDPTLLSVAWDASTDSTWTSPDLTSWSGDKYVDGQDVSFSDTGAGTVTVSGAVAPASVTVNNSTGNDYTFTGGAIGGSATLTKTGTGTLTLNATNTYAGGTTINDGRILMNNGDASGTGTITIGTAATANLLVADGITIDEPITLSGSGGGAVKLDSLGTSTFTGLVTMNGTTRIGNGGRTLNFDGGLTSAATQLFVADANFNVNPLTLGTSTLWQHVSDTFFGVTGNTWNHQVVAFGGSTTIGVNDALPTSSGVQFGWGNNAGWNTATLDLNGFNQEVAFIETVVSGQGLANNQDITGTSGTLTVNQSAGSRQYHGRITGGISLAKDGAGTLILNNQSGTPSSNTGSFTVNNGSLEIASGEDIGDAASVIVADVASASLDVVGTANTETIGGLTGGGATGGTVNIAAGNTLTVANAADDTFAGVIAGAGSLTKSDAGTLDIQLRSTYGGPTTVNGGTLRFTNDVDLRSVGTPAFFINNGSTLEFQSSVGGANRTVLNNKTFTFGASGGGTINFNGGNHLFQGGGNTHTFTTTGGSQNTISSTNGAFMNMQGSGNVEFDVADGPDPVDLELSALFSNGLITKNGAGTMSITTTTGAAGGNGGITINDGSLEVASGATLGGGTFPWPITNDGTFRYNSTGNQTITGNISGTGSLVKGNTGTLTLSGSNTYTGNTTANAGTLSLGDGTNNTNLADAADVVIAAGAVVDLNYGGTDTIDSLFLNGVQAVAGTWGATGSGAANIDDTYFTGTGTLTVITGSLYEQWADAYGLVGANRDLAADVESSGPDGLINLMEFAFGTDPTTSDNMELTVTLPSSFTPGTPVLHVDFSPFSLAVRFVRRVDHAAAGLVYTAQFSENLALWEDGTATPTVVVPDDGSGYEVVEVPYLLFLSNGKRAQFFRLAVTLN